jgi:hypothetical protein
MYTYIVLSYQRIDTLECISDVQDIAKRKQGKTKSKFH